MVTRIKPPTQPAESGEMQLAPLEFSAAPPPGLRKRLVTAVQHAYPGWTVTVTVVTWTPDEVRLRLHGSRDPSSGAPPAPLPGSEAADKLVRRTGNVLEKVLEKLYPGSKWGSDGNYSSPDRNTLDVEQSAARTRPTDPPTCADGPPTETPIFGIGSTVGTVLSFTNRDPKFPNGRWFFVHRPPPVASAPYPQLNVTTNSSSSPLSAVTFPWPNAMSTANVYPTISLNLTIGQTLAFLAPPGVTISIQASALVGCTVWWQM